MTVILCHHDRVGADMNVRGVSLTGSGKKIKKEKSNDQKVAIRISVLKDSNYYYIAKGHWSVGNYAELSAVQANKLYGHTPYASACIGIAISTFQRCEPNARVYGLNTQSKLNQATGRRIVLQEYRTNERCRSFIEFRLTDCKMT